MTAPQDMSPDEPVDPDEVAEEAPIDPTPQEVDEYRELIGDPLAEDPADDEVPEVIPSREADPLPEAPES